MAAFVLNRGIALRSWNDLLFGVYRQGMKRARNVGKAYFRVLCSCDGITEITDPEDLAVARCCVEAGLICECNPGSKKPEPWQFLKICDNDFRPILNWELTGRCNYRCLHCFNASDTRYGRNDMPYDQALRLIDEAAECGFLSVMLTGGEPLIHPRFTDIVRAIYGHGMAVHEINTNGRFLTKELLTELKEIGCFPEFKISFDGIGYHDWMRCCKGAEIDALSAIRLSVSEGFKTHVQMNVNKVNVGCLADSLDLLDGIGVKQIRLIRTTEVPAWVHNAPGCSLDWDQYFELILDAMIEYMMKPRKMNVDVWRYLYLNASQRQYRIKPVRYAKGALSADCRMCGMIGHSIAVSAEGIVYPCMQLSGELETVGDRRECVFDNGLKAVLRSAKWYDVVEMTVAQRGQICKDCGHCVHLAQCGGGCLAMSTLNGMLHGKTSIETALTSPDPAACAFWNGGWEERTEERMNGMTRAMHCGCMKEVLVKLTNPSQLSDEQLNDVVGGFSDCTLYTPCPSQCFLDC